MILAAHFSEGRVAPKRPIAPATFAGVQHCSGLMPDFELWTLTADIPGHCAGSTVNGKSIEAAGYDLPPKLTPEQERRRRAWYGRPESMGSRHPFSADEVVLASISRPLNEASGKPL